MSEQQQVAVEPAGVYEQFVVVAEDKWKLYGEKLETTHYDLHRSIACEQISTTRFDMNFGGFEWECTIAWRSQLTLKCNNEDANIQFEVFICDDKFLPMSYCTRFTNSCSKTFFDNGWKYLILNIRVLKRRSALPDFTSEHVKLGHLKSNHTLIVGGQTFHVYKELLSLNSHFFDRMFNGDFAEAKKAENKLAGETADPKLFHDFLAFMMVCTGGYIVLPNRTNVVGLMQLARFYQVDFLMETCQCFLENCHDMPVWERIMAAKELELKELESRIVSKLSTVEAWKELAMKLMESGYVIDREK